MDLYDISRTLSAELAVWPGDQPFQPTWSARIGRDSVVNVGAVRLSTHAGTHADAPLHFEAGGLAIDQVPLLQFIGPAYVHHTTDDPVRPGDLAAVDLRRYPRLLLRTRHSDVPDAVWDEALVPLLPETIDFLGEQGVVLVGTDAPSVDPADSTTLAAHHALARWNIINLENLVLREVPAGGYFLVALPLKLAGLDAAPVRAVLLPERATR
jgi:arylformamidase